MLHTAHLDEEVGRAGRAERRHIPREISAKVLECRAALETAVRRREDVGLKVTVTCTATGWTRSPGSCAAMNPAACDAYCGARRTPRGLCQDGVRATREA